MYETGTARSQAVDAHVGEARPVNPQETDMLGGFILRLKEPGGPVKGDESCKYGGGWEVPTSHETFKDLDLSQDPDLKASPYTEETPPCQQAREDDANQKNGLVGLSKI